jgi:putative FmdB family regulatory protein
MPTYEYECSSCGHHMDAFQSITARPLKKCPECGEPKLQRLIGTGAGIIFKGSGFYQTDYRSEEYKKAAKAEKDARSDTGKKDDKKTDSGKDKTAKKVAKKDSAAA